MKTPAVLRQYEKMGRHGDSKLAHVMPSEIALLKAFGGSGTRNPKTGLLEFFGAGADGTPGAGNGDEANAGGNNTGQGNAAGVGPGSDTTDMGQGSQTPGPAAANNAQETSNSIGAAASVGANDVADDGSLAITQQVVNALAVQQAIQDQQMMMDIGITSPSSQGIMGMIANIISPDISNSGIARGLMSLAMGGPIGPGMAHGIAQVGGAVAQAMGATNEGAAAAQGVVGTGGVDGGMEGQAPGVADAAAASAPGTAAASLYTPVGPALQSYTPPAFRASVAAPGVLGSYSQATQGQLPAILQAYADQEARFRAATQTPFTASVYQPGMWGA